MANYASGPKSAPNSDSFWVRRLFNVCVLVFCTPNATILLVYIPAKIKMSFVWKNDFFCQNRRYSQWRVDVVYQPLSCDVTPLDCYLWGTVIDKCYVDKPVTIDALKDNIREAIAEIQLHTIDNVLKYWTIWMKLFSIINRKDCTFK